jgi:hypothetical protein
MIIDELRSLRHVCLKSLAISGNHLEQVIRHDGRQAPCKYSVSMQTVAMISCGLSKSFLTLAARIVSTL